MASAARDKSCYEDHSPSQSNSETGKNSNSGSSSSNNNGTSSDHQHQPPPQPQLAVVPLHPACKKQKLEAKQLPIVLGRTNLASWWWKSCPCQHYCRLHCRPVAQNIRSLSKVMIQIDTAGQIHMCGKNPHLVTIIPERSDRYLQVNDIISIGRRDREPWIRLQVVEKPSRKQLSHRRLKTYTPEWITRPNNHHHHHHHHHRKSSSNSNGNSNGNGSGNGNSNQITASNHATSNNNNNNAPVAVAASNNHHNSNSNNYHNHSRHHSHNNTNQPSSTNNPPEWITTTRKRKSSRRAVNAMKPPSSSQPNGDSDSPPRKRSRRSDKRQRRSNKSNNGGGGDDADGGKNAPLVERDHHPQVHLVFQDYETSATLLRELQRKKRRGRKSENSSVSSGTPHVPRMFLAEKNQLKQLSKNFAAALRGKVPSRDSPMEEADSKPAAAENTAAANQGGGEEGKVGEKSDSSIPHNRIPNDELFETQPAAGDSNMAAAAAAAADILEKRDGTNSGLEKPHVVPARNDEQQGVSLLSLPQCGSSDHAEHHSSSERLALSNPQQPSDDNDDVNNVNHDAASSEDESAYTPGVRDPTADLERWREVLKKEEANGNESSFRHALASLVVAKNEKNPHFQRGMNTNNNNGGGSDDVFWLPPLLEAVDSTSSKQLQCHNSNDDS